MREGQPYLSDIHYHHVALALETQLIITILTFSVFVIQLFHVRIMLSGLGDTVSQLTDPKKRNERWVRDLAVDADTDMLAVTLSNEKKVYFYQLVREDNQQESDALVH